MSAYIKLTLCQCTESQRVFFLMQWREFFRYYEHSSITPLFSNLRLVQNVLTLVVASRNINEFQDRGNIKFLKSHQVQFLHYYDFLLSKKILTKF